MSLIDTLRNKVQETLNDPQKMDAIKSKVAGALNRRMNRGAQSGYYGPGYNPGMGGYVGGDNDGTTMQDRDVDIDHGGVSSDAGGWDTSGSSDSGGWGGGGSSDPGGGDGGGDDSGSNDG